MSEAERHPGFKLRIQVFKKHQDTATEAPAHTISAELALKICLEKLAKPLSEKAIILKTSESMRDIKKRFQPKYIPILAVRDWRECLLLSYPIKDQSSYA